MAFYGKRGTRPGIFNRLRYQERILDDQITPRPTQTLQRPSAKMVVWTRLTGLMKITVFYMTGVEQVIENVQSLKVLGPRMIEVQTFGNGPAIHRSVRWFRVDVFSFGPAATEHSVSNLPIRT